MDHAENAQTTPSPSYSRRTFLHTAALATGGMLLVGCATDPSTTARTKITSQPTVPPAQATAAVTNAIGKTYFPSGDPNIPDAYTAPLPEYQSVSYVPGSGKSINAFTLTYFTLPLTHDKNKYWLELEKRLNVKWNVTFATSPDVYREKVSTLLASGNLPELFWLNPDLSPALPQAIQQGAFTDLTSMLRGDALKEFPNLARISPAIWNNARFNGKLYGVPRPRILTGNVLAYRRDWAQKLGLDDPKNGKDFLALMRAFSKNKPGGSESWAMGIAPNGVASHIGFMNMHRVPNQWRREPDGHLTYFIETDEYKQAIDMMRQAFAAGYFYPDVTAQAGLKLQQNFTGGKTGMYVAGLNGIPLLRRLTKKMNPSIDVGTLIPFGADGGKGSHNLGTGFFGYTGIPSSVSDQGRVTELLRILDYLAAPTFSMESNYLLYGIDGWDSSVKKGIRTLTDNGTKEIQDLVTIAGGPFTYYYPTEPELGIQMQEDTKKLLAIGVSNPAVNAYSPTSVKQGGVLGEMLDDRILRILRGTDPLSSIDTMVQDWRKQGGDQIRKELEPQVKK
ncbi:putative ABC transporter peptide-binding protein YtcQ [Dictyobacter alpinus]|uniref:Putative ABC transporter peptide-binding protein YtcQ n=1 Tax=Dictyobacter alpinus TaxID=2014873 RepID=A0A402BDV0_9CHLR|nr:extracellular solute-binding protein [Dictyobacter alpinus]GCE29554.1 putative ABC transporter peptide-binding protein YtcQ [Dictyobacter alpinus]